MAHIFPFRPLRYAPTRVKLDLVTTQPYDKISAEMQDRYYGLDPHNLVRIILGRSQPDDAPGHNVYTRAAATMTAWKEAGVLENEPAAGFIAYFQEFAIPGGGGTRVRKGLVGLGRLEDYSNKVVFPHEKTLTGPKQDRLELMRHTKTHFEQIFMLYRDPERTIDGILDRVAAGPPEMEVLDEYGVRHRLWSIRDAGDIAAIQADMAPRPLIIADGHHRYETSLTYRDERRAAGPSEPDAPFTRMMMTFFNTESPGLTILPTHRVVRNVATFAASALLQNAGAYFEVATVKGGVGDVLARMKEGDGIRIGAKLEGHPDFLIFKLRTDLDLAGLLPDLSPRQRELDVVVLHRLLLDRCLGVTEESVKKESHLTYFRDAGKAVDEVAARGAQAVFLLNATRIEQVCDIALAGGVMPQKSTDFYPKVLSGLTMYSLD